jgi:hypothetical protein
VQRCQILRTVTHLKSGRWHSNRRGIRDTPEACRGPCEFNCNFGRTHQILIHIDHAALLLFPTGYILHEEHLPRRYQAS